MTEQAVTIPSAGLRLSGTVRVPAGVKPGEHRAAFLVLHGFGSNKSSSNVLPAEQGAAMISAMSRSVSTCGDAAKAKVNSAG